MGQMHVRILPRSVSTLGGILSFVNLDLSDVLKYSDEVAAAIASKSPIVALESTIFSHGLPRPLNLELAREVQAIIRAQGATPAMIAVINGDVHIGLSEADLEAITTRDDILRTSSRELAIAIAFGKSAATTLESASHLSSTAGIKVFSAGVLEGVQRIGTDFADESAELTALSGLDITVVCAGVKSILDIGPTINLLGSLNINVVGYQTKTFPALLITGTEFEITHQADTVEEIASKIKSNTSALIVLNPAINPMDKKLHDEILASGIESAAKEEITGKAVTPFLYEYFQSSSNGEALRIYVEILKSNAALAAEIAKI
jgi:pseudouridine-5'-phosphate glycosidase